MKFVSPEMIADTRPEGVATPAGFWRMARALLSRIEASEARHGWWSKNNSIGQPFQGLYPPQESTPEQSILNVDQFGIPQVMSVALHRDAIINATGNSDVFARVYYGVGSFNASFELDFANGMQASVVASSVRVALVPQAVNLTIPYSQGTTQLSVAAASGKFPAPNALPPTRTIRAMRDNGGWILQRVLAIGTPTQFENVPPFARSFYASSLAGVFDPGATISFVDIRGTTILTLTLDQLDNQRQVPLPGGVYQFRLSQAAYPYGFGPITYNFVFQLGL